MKAVMYGAGNIGRGFIGALFSKSGYEVTFIDIAEPVLRALNERHKYPVRTVSNEGFEDAWITNVRAVSANDTEAAANAIAEADIMATAVGVNVLKHIAPNIAAGLKRRFKNPRPLNIIICENLIDANRLLETMVKELLTYEEQVLFDRYVGMVEASIGRMVPVQTEDMKDGDPLRVCVERYGFLPVDKDAFKGTVPDIGNMIPCSPFDYYIKRKLYIHNMGHAACAYLGGFSGKTYIYESIDDPEIRIIAQNAMTESALALSKSFGTDVLPLTAHIHDLLIRFENNALKDTCERVGGDPRRKLSPSDRLIGSSGMCLEQGIFPVFITASAACAVYRLLKDENREQTALNASEILKEISGIRENDPRFEAIMRFYGMFAGGCSVRSVRKAADTLRAGRQGDIL
jgi:mannitol-1-phosphate 5-dehydrogenase